jgi:glycosyltransferase involved in cell wall biosynthesis
MKPLKIAIVVHGRFHSFDLARGLIERGNDVTILTNYPRQAAPRFGLLPSRIRSFPLHGLLGRAVAATGSVALGRGFEACGHQLFGRWAARMLARERWDAIHCWGGVAEETLRAEFPHDTLRLLMRGSSHVAVQRRLLQEEEARVAVPLDQPSDWIVEREQREYDLADRIVVLSSFARQSFIDQGIPASKISMLSLGVRVDAFKPTPDAVAERAARIRRGDPLNVLFVGTLSYRKGLWDLARVIASVDPARFRFVLVGKVMAEAEAMARSFGPHVQVIGKVPQAELPKTYARGDVFVFPTIEDGFAVVLAQAKAAGLPIITTPNGAGHDLVQSDRDGWIVPIRDADAIMARLRWCDANREALARTIASGASEMRSRSWTDVAAEFEDIVRGRHAAPARGALAHAG